MVHYHRAVVSPGERPEPTHRLSVVVPVYQGERSLTGLMRELEPFTSPFVTPRGHTAVVTEVLLVHDNGPDNSARVMRELAAAHPFVRTVWLSRNFGQHPATLAGMASSGGDWIVTMDEDGQHDPRFLVDMLDTALAEQADLVYAKPTNEAPHGFVRNGASKLAKRLVRSSTQKGTTDFFSYRLVLGEIGRAVAAYSGRGVYLDVALTWVAQHAVTCPVTLRAEADRPSGYSFRTLTSHFWRMVVTGGTRPLRLVSILGVIFALAGIVLALYFVVVKTFFGSTLPPGWPSLMVALLICSGAILFSLGIIAEYVGVAVNMAMGRPLYLIVSDPADGPLGRRSPVPPVPDAPAAVGPQRVGVPDRPPR